jgi:nucleotide-binding universal stress UspA family protein
MEKTSQKGPTVLVALDFSPCSITALRQAKSIMGVKPAKILALHVIDQDFVERCVRHALGDHKEIKKGLFLHSQEKLKGVLRQEGLEGEDIEEIICEGIPYIEINKMALRYGADMIVMGCRGNCADMSGIFFGSTTEKVLRFIKRPVLCVPEEENHKLD